MLETKPKMVSIRIAPDLHKSASRKLVDLETSFQAVLTEALTTWTYGEGKAPAAQPSANPKTRHAHELLDLILEHDREAADCISRNLEMFAEVIRARQRPERKKKAG
jgi:hypothetical protein